MNGFKPLAIEDFQLTDAELKELVEGAQTHFAPTSDVRDSERDFPVDPPATSPKS